MADFRPVNQDNTTFPAQNPEILSVSQVTAKIKVLLEKNIPFIWINGEISNLNTSANGHLYFNLKDTGAQINAVMFKTQRRGLMFAPKNGMNLNCLGRLNVYEERGTYQIIVEYAEQAGAGALHLEFEQLKARLEREGLFAAERKRPLPPYPRKIVLITSPTGAVIHDMQAVAQRKIPTIMEILPVKVQGQEAAAEIVNALKFLGTMPDVEVAILARGGGSREDLQPFNTEEVARAIAAAPLPVISAVGHETDFSISDFVADLRAPTPSAAIDMLLPDKDDLQLHLRNLTRRLQGGLQNRILLYKAVLNRLEMRLGMPKSRILEKKQRISYFEYKLKHSIIRQMQAHIQRLGLAKLRLARQSPRLKLNEKRHALAKADYRLKTAFENHFNRALNKTRFLQEKLLLLGPSATLDRGYSIVTDPFLNRVVSNAAMVKPGQSLEIIMKSGRLWCLVEKVNKDGEKEF